MAEIQQNSTVTKASWDEMNTGIFLQLLIDEIDAGNRPAGQFTRQAWVNITAKFQDLSGCKFTQPQLKNKWDNLKKEFSIWEKLLHDESGLGYDYATGRVIAEPAWWRQKIQERPEYKKFRTHGPVHLELQERVFRGHVATGYMEYIPPTNVANESLINGGENIRHIPTTTDREENNVQQTEEVPIDNVSNATQYRGPSRAANVPKRKRSRISSKNPSQGDVNANMIDLISQWHAESQYSVQNVQQNSEMSYEDALCMLTSLPWMDDDSQDYMDAMVLLEDPNKRVALCHIKDKPEEFVRRWIRKLQDEKNRRLF